MDERPRSRGGPPRGGVADQPVWDEPTRHVATAGDGPASPRPAGSPSERRVPPGRRLRRLTAAARRALSGPHKVAVRVTVVVVTLVVLLATILPTMLAVTQGLRDYQELRAIGESGLQHLLAAKDDFAGIKLDQLQRLAGPSATDAPYTLLVQRQAGTFYTMQVTVRPSPQLAHSGAKDLNTTATIDTNTPIAFGAKITTPNVTPVSGAASSPAALIPDAATVKKAQDELRLAQADFLRLQSRLHTPDWALSTAGALPGAGSKVAAVRALADVGVEVSAMGVELADAAIPLLPKLQHLSLSGDQAPLSQDDLTSLQQALTRASQHLATIQSRLADVSVDDLPVSDTQRALLRQTVANLPKIRGAVDDGAQAVGAVGWLLGMSEPRHFLVQTLDRAELRASGGFTGDYGTLTIDHGKIAPFTLTDINRLDYGKNGNGWIFGERAPDQYKWWPFSDWGLRDSNVSPDFPTTAKIAIDLFQKEGGGSVDGVIQFTPVVIEHVLKVTGPLRVALYDETITAENLEDKLHYYQQDPAGIAKEMALSPGDDTTSARKRFTSLVGQLLQDRLRHLPSDQLVPMASQMLADLRAKDIQVYLTNPAVESLLLKYHVAGAVDTASDVDSVLVVHSNVSVAKTTPYVNVAQTDTITLDNQGTATHHLTLKMNYQLTGPAYGYTTYRDYVRVYAPAQAKLIGGSGFDSNSPLCWAPPSSTTPIGKPAQFASMADCPANPYPQGELVCPSGGYGPGNQSPTLTGSDGYTPWPLDSVGAPPDTASDLPGRTMWGGFVVIPRSCTATLTLAWSVPHVVHG